MEIQIVQKAKTLELSPITKITLLQLKYVQIEIETLILKVIRELNPASIII